MYVTPFPPQTHPNTPADNTYPHHHHHHHHHHHQLHQLHHLHLHQLFDGWAARKYDQCSKFGGILDMVTDRLATCGVLPYHTTAPCPATRHLCTSCPLISPLPEP
jgi:hypothetical protein